MKAHTPVSLTYTITDYQGKELAKKDITWSITTGQGTKELTLTEQQVFIAPEEGAFTIQVTVPDGKDGTKTSTLHLESVTDYYAVSVPLAEGFTTPQEEGAYKVLTTTHTDVDYRGSRPPQRNSRTTPTTLPALFTTEESQLHIETGEQKALLELRVGTERKQEGRVTVNGITYEVISGNKAYPVTWLVPVESTNGTITLQFSQGLGILGITLTPTDESPPPELRIDETTQILMRIPEGKDK